MAVVNKYHRIYLGVLASIALLIAAAVLAIDYIAAEESLMTELDETGSRQQLLSERIVHLTLEYAATRDVGSREEIVNMIEQSLKSFDNTHQLLIRGQLENGHVVGFPENVDDIFFGAPVFLDEKVRIFIYNTREVLLSDWTPRLISSFYFEELRNATLSDLHSSLEILAAQYSLNGGERIVRLRIITASLLGGIILVLIGVGLFVFKPLFQRIGEQEQELQYLAFIDPLTNCHNRRSFLTSAETEFERSRRYHHALSILYLDIDYFKNINDSFGHAVGDLAIKQLTDIFLDSIRDSDILGRIGGDEFGIVLLESNLEKATQIAEKLRINVEQFVCSGELSEVKFSVSVGVASSISSDANAYDTLKRADENMYTSKETGRNTVVSA
jgi:diguanylate cyclase (GGDEF)-like protein